MAHPNLGLGANSFGQGIDALDALGMEIITTFALVLIWLACAVDPYVRRRLAARNHPRSQHAHAASRQRAPIAIRRSCLASAACRTGCARLRQPLERHKYAPIPIGFAYAVGILATGNLSGGSMNPARSLGPAVAMNVWDGSWVYWIGPLLGATLGGALQLGWKQAAFWPTPTCSVSLLCIAAGITHRFAFLPRNPDAVPRPSVSAEEYHSHASYEFQHR